MSIADKKVAVVTGASSGIGKAISEKLIKNDLNLVLNSRTVKDVFSSKNSYVLNSMDLTDEATPSELLKESLSNFKRCDYLVVNAGIIESGTIESIDIEKVCKMARLKVESSYRLIYTFLKHFKKVNSGHIIIISSVLGTKTREHSGAYAGCNYALEALAEGLRMELADTNVQISCIEPGLVETNLHRDWGVHPKELLGISEALKPTDIADAMLEIINKPDHIRIPKYMILPRGHKI